MNAHRAISAAAGELGEITQVIGPDAARKLVDALGGTDLYIPKLIGRHNPIMVAIGPAASARLAEYYHGRVIKLPKAHARRQRALELARQAKESGGEIRIADVALATDFTERHIYRMLARDEADSDGDADDGQPDLFETP
ncbi:hypothetical protein D1610_11565 [Sphingomonas gilva]|uniref:Mor transcription activator domain-containing protein n=1 Tax=Sphingomonas gilva TaxID=2305907 RepID=A0A396RLI5_9SPHN|nr:hypothetical protein [Sphingomonas gilva]RHW17180.1 hypothetical protein D1610_11565 [Sphingomonas gilva]